HHAEGQRSAAVPDRRGHHREAEQHDDRAEGPAGREVGTLHSTALDESMITRAGRSLSTVSSVRPKSEAPVRRGGSGMTIARARMSLASSTTRLPAWPGLTFSQCPVTRRPPRTRAESITDAAFASCSGMEALIGAFGGTVIVTSTCTPRRRRAAMRTAVRTALAE